MRYDTIWRRIRPDEYTGKLEGRFGDRLQRLDGLNNWGPLAWLFDHATATKQAHHYGVERNAMAFVAADSEREKHKTSIRVASHVMHWGHLPLSYGGEEALTRAAHVDPKIHAVLVDIIQKVIDAGGLKCDAEGHDCAAAVRDGERPFDLYRWLSAWLVARDSKALWKAIRAAAPHESDEAAMRKEIIRTLVCREALGNRVLGLCNQADYVCRDLLQAGTAWLTVDIDALWEGNPLGTDAAREWSLIRGARDYLEMRFFHAPESLLVHSFAARAMANGFLANKSFSPDDVLNLLELRDSEVDGSLVGYHGKRLKQVRDDAKRGALLRRWTHVGTFNDVSFDAGSRLEIEDWLTGKTGRARVSYPFTSGVSVVVDPGVAGEIPPVFAGRERRYAAVHLHHESPCDGSPPNARPLLDVVSKLNSRAASSLGAPVMSWLCRGRAEERPAAQDDCVRELFSANEAAVRSLVTKQMRMASLAPVVGHLYTAISLGTLAEEGEMSSPTLAPMLLTLPFAWHRTKAGKDLLVVLRDAAFKEALTHTPKARRGAFLELAVCADEWLADGDVADRFVYRGVTLLGKDGVPECEFDVVRIDLIRDGTWTVCATECTISRTKAKDDADRAKLERLRELLQDRFADLAGLTTKLATVKRSYAAVNYADAGRSFSAQV